MKKIVSAFLLGMYASIVVGGIVGLALRDLAKGLQTVQCLLAILALAWVLLLAWPRRSSNRNTEM